MTIAYPCTWSIYTSLTADSISFWSSVFIDLNTSSSSWSVVTVRLSCSNSSSCWLVRLAGTDDSSDGSEVASSAAAWATANDAWQTSRSFSYKDWSTAYFSLKCQHNSKNSVLLNSHNYHYKKYNICTKEKSYCDLRTALTNFSIFSSLVLICSCSESRLCCRSLIWFFRLISSSPSVKNDSVTPLWGW